MCKNKRQKGFTLIELLVVVAIISLLSSIVLVALNDARAKARDQALVQQVKQIQNALELYRAKFGEYPDNSPNSIASNYYTSHIKNTGVWVGSTGSPNQYPPNRLIDRLKDNGFLSEIKSQKYDFLYYSYFNGDDSSTSARMKCEDGTSTIPKYLIGFIPETNAVKNSFPRILYTTSGTPGVVANYYQYNCVSIN